MEDLPLDYASDIIDYNELEPSIKNHNYGTLPFFQGTIGGRHLNTTITTITIVYNNSNYNAQKLKKKKFWDRFRDHPMANVVTWSGDTQ